MNTDLSCPVLPVLRSSFGKPSCQSVSQPERAGICYQDGKGTIYRGVSRWVSSRNRARTQCQYMRAILAPPDPEGSDDGVVPEPTGSFSEGHSSARLLSDLQVEAHGQLQGVPRGERQRTRDPSSPDSSLRALLCPNSWHSEGEGVLVNPPGRLSSAESKVEAEGRWVWKGPTRHRGGAWESQGFREQMLHAARIGGPWSGVNCQLHQDSVLAESYTTISPLQP